MSPVRLTEPIDVAVDRAAKEIIAELIQPQSSSDDKAILDRFRSHLTALFAEFGNIDHFTVVMRLHDQLAELEPALAERLMNAIGMLLTDKT
jgi:hypothetical protein